MKRHLVLVAAVAAATLTPVAAGANNECSRSETQASFTKPTDGQIVIKTQAVNTQFTMQGDPAGLGTGLMLSTTGTVDVEIAHECVDKLRLTVTKDGEVIHTNNFDTECEAGTTTDVVEVGLDAGEFVFSLDESMGCNGKPLRHAGDGHYVGDPPLPI